METDSYVDESKKAFKKKHEEKEAAIENYDKAIAALEKAIKTYKWLGYFAIIILLTALGALCGGPIGALIGVIIGIILSIFFEEVLLEKLNENLDNLKERRRAWIDELVRQQRETA